MSREKLSRRGLLLLPPLSLLIACSEIEGNQSYKLRKNIKQGHEEIFLPFGASNPETGIYTIFLDPIPDNVLASGKASYERGFQDKDLRVQFKLIQVAPRSVDVSFQIGRSSDRVSRSTIAVTVELLTLDTTHEISVSWKDWSAQDIRYNGTVISKHDVSLDRLVKKD